MGILNLKISKIKRLEGTILNLIERAKIVIVKGKIKKNKMELILQNF
jgi:transcription-repair coupling factor (superfamily II helicase)